MSDNELEGTFHNVLAQDSLKGARAALFRNRDVPNDAATPLSHSGTNAVSDLDSHSLFGPASVTSAVGSHAPLSVNMPSRRHVLNALSSISRSSSLRASQLAASSTAGRNAVPALALEESRHPLLLYYRNIDSNFEKDFAVFYYSNRAVTIVFVAILSVLSIASVATAPDATAKLPYYIAAWLLWVAAAATLIALWAYRGSSASTLFVDEATVEKSRPYSIATSITTLTSNFVELVSEQQEHRTSWLHLDAILHECATIVCLQAGVLACIGEVAAKSSTDVQPAFFAKAILNDGLFVLVVVLSALLCPIRLSRYVPNLVVMLVLFIAPRWSPDFPHIDRAYIVAEVVVIAFVSIASSVYVFVAEVRRRTEFESVWNLRLHLSTANEAHRRSITMLSGKLPLGIRVEGLGEQAGVLWCERGCMCLDISLENMDAWCSYRSSVDAADLLMRFFAAIEEAKTDSLSFLEGAGLEMRSRTTPSGKHWDVVIGQPHGDHVCALVPPLDEHSQHESLCVAVSFGIVVCQRAEKIIHQLGVSQNTFLTPEGSVENRRSTSSSCKAMCLGARVGIEVGLAYVTVAQEGGGLMLHGPGFERAALLSLSERVPFMGSQRNAWVVSAFMMGPCAQEVLTSSASSKVEQLEVFPSSSEESPFELSLVRLHLDVAAGSPRSNPLTPSVAGDHFPPTTAPRSIVADLFFVTRRTIAVGETFHSSNSTLATDSSNTVDRYSGSIGGGSRLFEKPTQEVEEKLDDDDAASHSSLIPNAATAVFYQWCIFPRFECVDTEAYFEIFVHDEEWLLGKSLAMWSYALGMHVVLAVIFAMHDELFAAGFSDDPLANSSLRLVAGLILTAAPIVIYYISLLVGIIATSVTSIIAFVDDLLAVVVVGNYLGVIATAEEGSVLGDGRVIWLFLLDGFLLARPNRRSLLFTWALDILASAAFIVECAFHTRGPDSNYRYFNLTVGVVHAFFTLAVRLSWDRSRRANFAIGMELAYVQEVLDRDSKSIESVLKGMAPRGLAGEMIQRAQGKVKSFKMARQLHPDRSTQFTTTSDDVEMLIIELTPTVQLTRGSGRGDSSSFGESVRVSHSHRLMSLMPAKKNRESLIGSEDSALCAVREICMRIREYVVAARIPMHFAKSSSRCLILVISKAELALRRTEQGIPQPKKKADSEDSAATLLRCVPFVFSVLQGAKDFVTFKAVLVSGVVTGVVIGKERPSFEYCGAPVSAAFRLLREDVVPCGSCVALSRFARRCVLGLDSSITAIARVDLDDMNCPEIFPIGETPQATFEVTIGAFKLAKFAGLPAVGFHIISFKVTATETQESSA